MAFSTATASPPLIGAAHLTPAGSFRSAAAVKLNRPQDKISYSALSSGRECKKSICRLQALTAHNLRDKAADNDTYSPPP